MPIGNLIMQRKGRPNIFPPAKVRGDARASQILLPGDGMVYRSDFFCRICGLCDGTTFTDGGEDVNNSE